MFAELGLKYIHKSPLKFDVKYPGDYGLIFQKAFSGWYIGKRDLSKKLFLNLKNLPDINKQYRKLIEQNCKNFNLT